MKLAVAQIERRSFLARVTTRECAHLLDTDRRLFADVFTVEVARKIAADCILAERLDAFASRFGRLQDTIGDKLIPALLIALAEPFGPVAENLDRAEIFGFIESADAWLEPRKLRNQMVHEYIEDLAVLSSALRSGHGFVPALVAAAGRCVMEAERLIEKSTQT